MISSSECGVLLLAVIVAAFVFSVLLRCSFSSYWKVDFNQLQIRSMIWASSLQIRERGHSGDFYFIILFVGILQLLLYAINMDVVRLFADLSFLFLAMLNLYLHVMYSINYWNEWISLFLSKKNNNWQLLSCCQSRIMSNSFSITKRISKKRHTCACQNKFM